MIIKMLLEALFNVFSLMTLPINLPDLPSDVFSYIEEGFSYITAGGGILANYTPLPYLMVLLGLIVAIDIGIKLYHFIMWVLKKIPMAGIS